MLLKMTIAIVESDKRFVFENIKPIINTIINVVGIFFEFLINELFFFEITNNMKL